MWPLYDLEGIYNKTDSTTKNSLVFSFSLHHQIDYCLQFYV